MTDPIAVDPEPYGYASVLIRTPAAEALLISRWTRSTLRCEVLLRWQRWACAPLASAAETTSAAPS